MTTLAIQRLAKGTWTKSWAGFWSILFCSWYQRVYTDLLRQRAGAGIRTGIFLTRQGFTTCYLNLEARRHYGEAVARRFGSKTFAQHWCQEWIRAGRLLMAWTKRHPRPRPDETTYNQYRKLLEPYAALHIGAKNVVDYLSEAGLARTRAIFEHARIATEPVYTDSERFLRRFAAAVGRKARLRGSLVTCLTEEELYAWLRTQSLLTQSVLEQRQRGFTQWFQDRKREILTPRGTNVLEQYLNRQSGGLLTGTAAYPGKILGTARIVFDPSSPGVFNAGDILITTMTRPEYVPLMKRAGAIVTDGGGLLSHAAIVARELKKPTVIGTERATTTFRTGERVLVDANGGLVKRLPR